MSGDFIADAVALDVDPNVLRLSTCRHCGKRHPVLSMARACERRHEEEWAE